MRLVRPLNDKTSREGEAAECPGICAESEDEQMLSGTHADIQLSELTKMYYRRGVCSLEPIISEVGDEGLEPPTFAV